MILQQLTQLELAVSWFRDVGIPGRVSRSTPEGSAVRANAELPSKESSVEKEMNVPSTKVANRKKVQEKNFILKTARDRENEVNFSVLKENIWPEKVENE